MSPDLLRALVEQAPDAIIFADRDGRIRLWNAAAEKLFGYSAAEADGQSLDLIIPEHLRARHWEGFHRAIREKRTRSGGKAILTRAVPRDGGKLYVEVAFSIVVDAAGEAAGALAIAREGRPSR